MNTIPARLRLLGAGVLELILLGLAVGFALVTATGIALNANSGVERWQTDIANADLQLDRKTLAPLTQAWCHKMRVPLVGRSCCSGTSQKIHPPQKTRIHYLRMCCRYSLVSNHLPTLLFLSMCE